MHQQKFKQMLVYEKSCTLHHFLVFLCVILSQDTSIFAIFSFLCDNIAPAGCRTMGSKGVKKKN
jgi:hypothetical protein